MKLSLSFRSLMLATLLSSFSTRVVLAQQSPPAVAPPTVTPAAEQGAALSPEGAPVEESKVAPAGVESQQSAAGQQSSAPAPRLVDAPPAASATTEQPAATAAPAVEDSAAAPAPPAHVASWADNLTLGGGGVLYYYQPTKGDAKNDFSVFFVNLLLDGKWDKVGFHVEPRFRDSKLRPFFDGPAWLQEAYASLDLAPIKIKVGKTYKRSGGLFWDNSFYGNVQVYDGLKLDPNYGISLEGGVGERLGVDFVAQFFIVDGHTNVSLQGRDTISVPGARRRNTVAARLEPWVKFGDGEARIGLSAEHFKADLPDAGQSVSRLAGDAKFIYSFGDSGALGAWGEFLHQDGRHVIDHPAVGLASKNVNYFLAGAEYSYWRITARYNVSHADYKDANTTEILHVPGLGVKVNDNVSVLGEYAYWRQKTPSTTVPYDTAVNITLSGHY